MRASRLAAGLAAGLLVGLLATPAVAAPGDKPGDKPGGTTPGDTTAQDCPPGETLQGGRCKPPPDTQAPPAPALGDPLIEPEGKVTLPFVAEKASHVVIKENQGDIAQARATGQSQQSTWTTTSGSHTYSVTATDKAGNESPAATVTIDVDADPPTYTGFVVKPGTAKDTHSEIRFSTEPATTYSLLVDGKEIKSGTTGAQGRERIETVLDLPDGRHPVELNLEDETGNTTSATQKLVVKIPQLSVDAELLSDSIDTEQVIRVRATPGGTGVLKIDGEQPKDFRISSNGTAEVRLPLTDGTYDEPTVVVQDSQGRRGSTVMQPIVVDTTPPVLLVEPSRSAADDGRLVVAVTADKGSVVNWSVLDSSGTEVTAGKFVANGQAQTVARDLEKGSYTFSVSAVDVYDRTTEKQADVAVAADPLSTQTLVLAGLGLLLVLLALIAIGMRLWRRHRDKVAQRKQLAPIPATKENIAAYERAEAAWAVQHRKLSRLADVARGDVPHDVALPFGFEVLPDETALWVTSARLISLVESGGEEVAMETESGQLVVTTMRFAFVGRHNRDWYHSMVDRVRHLDHERTVLRMREGEDWTGFAYDDAQLTQQYIDLAVAGAGGEQASYLGVVSRGLRDHELRRPSPPG